MRPVHTDTIKRCRGYFSLIAAMLALSSTTAGAAPAPQAPVTSTGAYTVTYGSCAGCSMAWLEERAAGSASWMTVGNSGVSFADKADGSYDYRAALLYWGGGFNYWLEYSEIATVVVGNNLPVAEPLIEQFQHQYTARIGHFDGDGRPDLFIERTRGGSGNDGTLQYVILRGVGSGFQPVIPSAAHLASARKWPVAAVRLALHDVNLDGFVDLLIGGAGRLPGLAGTAAQIVFAPGRVASVAPKGISAVAGALGAMGQDLGHYLVEPDYFAVHAPLQVVPVTYYDFSCQYTGFDTIYAAFDVCYPYPVTTYAIVPDYSSFAAAAIRIWQHEDAISRGSVSRQSGYAEIKALIEESLGTEIGDWELKKLLGEAASTIDPTLERGIELFAALAGISNAVAQESETGGNGTTDPDAVLLTGRRVMGVGPFHTALQYGDSTVSAFDDDSRALFDGTLVSQVNWPPDHPALTMRLGRVASPLSGALYWQRLLVADAGYGDDLRYDAVPSIGAGGYNSNGFVAGIIAATSGIPSPPLTRFIGGERPVPRSNFN